MWAVILGLLCLTVGEILTRQHATNATTEDTTKIFLQRYPSQEQQQLSTNRTITSKSPTTNVPVPRLPETPERRGNKHRKQNSLNDPLSVSGSSQTSSRKPNIVLILTDDQDVELGSLQFMPFTSRLLKAEGAEFRHAYVTTPMCCPSRSSLLTGMLVHNHQVFTNNDNCSGHTWQATHETRSFATYLSNSGYRTGYVGKYLNKYNGHHIPPGWREWAALIMNSRYYNYSINVNGQRIKHGNDYAKDYYTDLIANDSIAFLKQSKQTFSKKPVMLVMSFPAPHGPEDSAPQYSDMFFNVTAHHTPSYNYAPNPDKQWILRVTNKMQPIHKQFTDLLMTKRLQTLQSVDAAVKRVYETLLDLGELENTYIFYTSDHGYHLGQFGLVKGKSFPFEFDVKVPLLVRGPGIDPGTIVDDVVLNVDLAPTFIDLSGEDPPGHMDGRSIIPLLHKSSNKARRNKHLRSWPDTFLIESSGRREKFGKQVPNTLSKTDRLNKECKSPVFQAPCQPRQKWYCVKEHGRWRKHKCKPSNLGRSAMRKVNRRKCTCFPQSLIPSQSLMLSLNLPEQKVQRNFLRTHLPASHHHKIMRTRFLKTPFLRVQRSVQHRRRRGKRNLMGLLDSFVGGVTKQMQELIQESNSTSAFTAAEVVTVQPNATRTAAARCRVLVSGTVNCSRAVYQNSKQWRRSKQDVDAQIMKLKEQLETLKEIRKHLREKKPYNAPVEEAEEDGESEEDEDDDDNDDENEDPEEEDGDDEEEEDLFTEDDLATSTIGYSTTKAPTTPGIFQTKEPVFSTTTAKSPVNSTAAPVEATHGVSAHRDRNGNVCICQPDRIAEARRRMKEMRLKKKERKMRRKSRLEIECVHEKMNCFSHDNDHWKTEPLWTEGPFCVCMNAINNTYSCLRTINATHNFLYCEFTTGHVTYYNLRIDPFELFNRAHELQPRELTSLQARLAQLKDCRGALECRNNNPPPHSDPYVNAEVFRRRKPGIGR
ncbi:extracellular sulfatase SULF-1 homolog isoform X2 [Neocloeon triangulifer]|uniref:extracellular sulfatase SULF-1 homolog isoform X2 n=1 Tax=Neocloeon triangulifer TaxID=2078957 RepID=UPI00286F486F|nr:extracellular sulfatase SULF-1 homolog isoform X2 [Neocloeon triangulifer]